MSTLQMRDGYGINYSYENAYSPKATVIISHGFAEHMGRYDYFSRALISNGLNVLRYDLRGHGANIDRGYLRNFEDYVNDLNELKLFAKNTDPNLPIFLIGHSMGGLITSLYCTSFNEGVRGVVLSGPSVGRLPSAKGYNRGLMNLMKILAGRASLKNPIGEGICGDPQVFLDYASDELVLHKATISFYYEFLFNGTDSLNEKLTSFSSPCLICHGEKDPIVPLELSRSFYEGVSSKDKSIIVYEGLYHEILNEKKKDQVIEDMVSWINERI
ncbi:alpha/beta hydrolase [Gudongella oleilytica]|uniref:alpha/beta hydrolase n=1 Tax=Gudongella oleilytica TaxID=1582259 RepID=UPI0013E8B4B0|nr:alpha/beta hydrolase [Gudongella oleilytica]HMM69387.1 alpha/beta hydrolase [Gudongella oleilytica]